MNLMLQWHRIWYYDECVYCHVLYGWANSLLFLPRTIGVGAQSTFGPRHFFSKIMYEKINTNARIVRDICPKMSEFYMIISRKIFFPIFFWGGGTCLCRELRCLWLPPPYKYDNNSRGRETLTRMLRGRTLSASFVNSYINVTVHFMLIF